MIVPLIVLAGCSIPQRLRGGPRHADASPTAAEGTAEGARPVVAGAQIAQLPDDGMTSATHAKYVGQIVFANAQIAKDHPDEASFASEFEADELIYGRVYMPRSMENHPVYADGSATPQRNRGLGFFYKLYVDGALVPDQVETGEAKREQRTATTRQVWLRPSPQDEPTSPSWTKLVGELAPGAHTLRLELWTRDGGYVAHAPLATGELTLHKTAGTTVAIGKTFADLAPGMKDPALASQLLAAARAFVERAGTKDTVSDLTIKSTEWNKLREKGSRRVVAREIAAWVRSDWPDGRCTAQVMWFVQRMELSGPVGPITQKAVGEEQQLDCVARQQATGDRWAGRTRARPTPTATKTEVATVTKPAPAATKPVPAAEPVHAAAPVAVATASAEPAMSTTATLATVRAPHRGRFSLGAGVATNAIDAMGVASYANLGVHLDRLEVGVGATWPLDVLGYARFAVLAGRFEVAPMISASMLAESEMDRQVALAGGLSLAYQLLSGPMAVGLRVDALVSYNLDPAKVAVPVLGSTYVRF